jgi:hypothetical protein
VISSIYRLGALLAVEGAICAVFLLRMVMSWRAGDADTKLGLA